MTFNTDPKNPLKYDIRLDDDVDSVIAATSYRLVPDAPRPGELPPGDLPDGLDGRVSETSVDQETCN